MVWPHQLPLVKMEPRSIQPKLLRAEQREKKNSQKLGVGIQVTADGARGDRVNQTYSDYSLKVGLTVFLNVYIV